MTGTPNYEQRTLTYIRAGKGSPTIDATLYSAIREQFSGAETTAVQVLGLERIADLNRLLAATEPVREEFRNHFSFPLVIWVNNTVQSQWFQAAPNLNSWGVTKEFIVSADYVADFLKEKAEDVFSGSFQITRSEAIASDLIESSDIIEQKSTMLPKLEMVGYGAPSKVMVFSERS